MYVHNTYIMNITHTFLSAEFHHLAVFLKPAFCWCPGFTDFTVNMLFWTNFCSQKLKRRILATFGFNRTPLRATQPKLNSMFCALFFEDRIISRRADRWPPRSCDLAPLDYYLWGDGKEKCYADMPDIYIYIGSAI